MNDKLLESVKEISLAFYADAMEPIRLLKSPAIAERGWA
jgi:hypothetical protein